MEDLALQSIFKRWVRPVSYTHLDVYKRQLQQLVLSGIIIEGLGKSVPESHYMGTALRSGDVIYKSIGILIIRIIVLHGHFHSHVVHRSLTVDDIFIEGSGGWANGSYPAGWHEDSHLPLWS